MGLRPTKDCIEEGEGNPPPLLKKINISPDYAKVKKIILESILIKKLNSGVPINMPDILFVNSYSIVLISREHGCNV